MAFLPDLTAAASTRTVEKGVERRNRDKRSGYRVSLANCKSTRGQEDCDNVVSRCQRSGQANKSQRVSKETYDLNARYSALYLLKG